MKPCFSKTIFLWLIFEWSFTWIELLVGSHLPLEVWRHCLWSLAFTVAVKKSEAVLILDDLFGFLVCFIFWKLRKSSLWNITVMCLGEGLFSYILVATWRFERPTGDFIGLFYGYFPPLHFPCVLFLELLAIRYCLSWTCPLVFAIFSLLFSLFYSEGFTHFSLLVFLSSFKFLIMFLTFNNSSILFECFFFF